MQLQIHQYHTLIAFNTICYAQINSNVIVSASYVQSRTVLHSGLFQYSTG
jgi:hypothetical protein